VGLLVILGLAAVIVWMIETDRSIQALG